MTARTGCLLGCEGFGHDPGCPMAETMRRVDENRRTAGMGLPQGGTCDRPCQAWSLARLTRDGGVGIPPTPCPCREARAAHEDDR